MAFSDPYEPANHTSWNWRVGYSGDWSRVVSNVNGSRAFQWKFPPSVTPLGRSAPWISWMRRPLGTGDIGLR